MSHKIEQPTEIPTETDEAAHETRGVAGFALSLKVAAFLPLVLLSGVVVGKLGMFDSGQEGPAEQASRSSSLVVDDRTPSLDQLPDTGRKHHKKAGDKKSAATQDASPSEAASPSQSPSSSPSSSPSRSPSSSPTKSPSKSPSPSPTPTPEEARQQCMEEGVNPLDLEAMAECIAGILND